MAYSSIRARLTRGLCVLIRGVMIPITGAACHIEIGITNWDIPNNPVLVDRRALAFRRREMPREALETRIRAPRNRPPLGVRRGTTRLLLDSRKASDLHGTRPPPGRHDLGQSLRVIGHDYQTPTHLEMIGLRSDVPPVVHARHRGKARRGRDRRTRIVPRARRPLMPQEQGHGHHHRRLVHRAADTSIALRAVQRLRVAPPPHADASHLQSPNE